MVDQSLMQTMPYFVMYYALLQASLQGQKIIHSDIEIFMQTTEGLFSFLNTNICFKDANQCISTSEISFVSFHLTL